MTPVSRECLVYFIHAYSQRITGRVADYGGAGKWGREVRRLLRPLQINSYIALDYTTGIDLMKPIRGKKYDVGICMDLLEHTTNPFVVAKNITNSLKSGALLFVTVPFIWCVHEYPKDYFRFTVDGIKMVFPKLRCLEAQYASDLDKPVPKGMVDDIDRLWVTRVVAIFEKIGAPNGSKDG
jgi:hypothetical protein